MAVAGKGQRASYKIVIPEIVKAAARAPDRTLFPDDSEAEICMAKNVTEPVISDNFCHTNEICMAKIDTTNAICMAEIDTHLNPRTQNPSPCAQPDWGEVVSKLSEIGLTTSSPTASVARDAGYTPELVLAIAEHFRLHPGAWQSAGVVRNAILNHPATLAADARERWPAMSQEFGLRQNHEKQRERAEADQRRRAAHAEQVSRDRIERDFNPGWQKQRILEYIRGKGIHGATDAEIQQALKLRGDTQRPRRRELEQAGLIREAIQHRRGCKVWVSLDGVRGC